MILISSDHHHDLWPQFASTTSNGRTNRFEEGLQAEQYLIDVCKQYNVQAHLRLGDMFHTKDVLPVIVVRDVMEIVESYPCNNFFLHGNHDAAAGGLRSAVELFGALKNCMPIVEAQTVHGGDQSDSQYQNWFFLPYYDTIAGYEKGFAELRHEYERRNELSTINLLFSHIGISGAKVSSEYRLQSEITGNLLRMHDFDRCFFGHYHLPQAVARNAYYVGSLLQRSFSDVGSPRRALLYGNGELRQIPIPGPAFLKFTVSNDEDYEALAKAMFPNNATKIYVKVAAAPKFAKADIVKIMPSMVAGLAVTPLHLATRPVKQDESEDIVAYVSTDYEQPASLTNAFADWIKRQPTELNKDDLVQLGSKIINESL